MRTAKRKTSSLRRLGPLAAVLAAAAALLAAPAPAATAAPVLRVTSNHYPTHFEPGGSGKYQIAVRNIGEDPADDVSEPITVEVELPEGIVATETEDGVGGLVWGCEITSEGSLVSCQYDPAEFLGLIFEGGSLIEAGRQACDHFGFRCPITVSVDIAAEADPGTASVEACGGEAPSCATDEDPTGVSATPAEFGVKRLKWDVLGEDRAPSSEAGRHPWAMFTGVQMNTVPASNSLGAKPADSLKTFALRLPEGVVGDPTATPTRCTRDELEEFECPLSSQVGTVNVRAASFNETRPLYNLVPSPDTAAQFGVNIEDVAFIIASATVSPDGDHAVTVTTRSISEAEFVFEVEMSIWGVPADPSHDSQRGTCAYHAGLCPLAPDTPVRPFLANPTSCAGPYPGSVSLEPWNVNPGVFETATVDAYPQGLEGCEKLRFEPQVSVQPVSKQAGSPSGYEIGLENQDEGLPTSHLKDVELSLPEGVTVNPASAHGLAACSPSQIGLDSDSEPSCPSSSQIGTAQVETPLLEDPLDGRLFLASQGDNPFGSLLAVYLVIEGPGVLVKLPGRVEVDPQTGRLKTRFADNPQLPFSELEVQLKGGPTAPLVNPPSCGTHTSEASLTPWARPEAPVAVSDSFQLDCPADRGFSPGFEAGSVIPLAGDYSTFVTKLSREDGTQEIKGLDLTLPPGLVGKLAGLDYCPEAALAAAGAKSGTEEQAAPSCPETSRVGTIQAGVGAGSSPLYVPGTAYLSGPYKGAPLSLAVITPAVAGPFDLGTVVVRAALEVDPQTAQVHAISDEIPHILQGIPLHLKDLRVTMDRPEFTLNPTSCDPMAIEGNATGAGADLLTAADDTLAALFNRFQVGGCRGLGFKPRLSFNLKGGTKRGAHPALRAVLKARPGDANIAKAVVTLPRSEFLDQGHINTVCTRVQFAADSCPKGSIYGFAKAITPLLDQPLSGPVYLRSSDNDLPDLVAALNGQIEIELAGRIDSVNGGGIRTTFASVPDAPVSKFILTMKGGRKGLLVNSTDLCDGVHRASAKFDGHNGRIHDFAPKLRAGCKAPLRKGKRRG
jgi:hypothetical protein